MNHEERQLLCDRIINACVFIEDHGSYLMVRDPSLWEKTLAEKYYQSSLENYILEGLNTKEEMMVIMLKRGLWTSEEEETVKKLQEAKKELQKKVTQLNFKTHEREYVLQLIGNVDKNLKKLINIKNSLLLNTVEYYAHTDKYKKLLFLCTYKPDGTRKWTDWNVFVDLDEKGILRLLSESFFKNEINESKIRELARSEPWRSTWIIANKVGDLFSRPVTEYTDYQKVLCTWSVIYDNIFENPECPDDSVLSDDELLDAWLSEQSDKRKSDRSKKITENDKINQAGEVGIVVDSIEDVQKVYNLNDSITRNVIRKREEKINKEKIVKECNLPDVKQGIMQELNRKHFGKFK